MSVLGLRVSAQEIRYAILEKDQLGEIVFINKDTENRIKYPANIKRIEEKLRWTKSEIDRILRVNPLIDKIVIKTNEFIKESWTTRETTYIDAIFLLAANEKNISVVRRLNSQIGSTAKKAKALAETRVGRTDKYWNNTIADAILAAYWGINNDF